MAPKQLPQDIKRTIISIFHCLAIVTTVLRLAHRHCTRRLWWDDLWAFFALICSVTTFVLFWCISWLRPRIDDTIPVPLISFLAVGILVFYVAGLWCARISVAVTIVRLLCDGKFRTIAKIVTFLFGVGATVLILVRVFQCGVKFDKPPLCGIPAHTVYTELVLDLLADAWLVSAPLVMLFRIARSLSSAHRRLISCIFSCGLFTTAASIVHIVFMAAQRSSLTGFSAHIQLGISIVVCNLLVLVTYVYRKYQPHEETQTLQHPPIPTLDTPQATELGRSRESRPAGLSPPDTTASRDNQGGLTFLSFTELGSSMLGGSSRDTAASEVYTSGFAKDSQSHNVSASAPTVDKAPAENDTPLLTD
ncbi:hypothetical protein BJ165DRAFT_1071966 [Panaeolus papilionaceus]|nr:hypothetical protein BJ165DRAFT_1071966 [Panaeolus papilionaceus]